jgi:hypothetical protein
VRVRVQIRSCGICDGQSVTGAGLLGLLLFPLPILIPPHAPHSSSIRGWYSRPKSARRTTWNRSHPCELKICEECSQDRPMRGAKGEFLGMYTSPKNLLTSVFPSVCTQGSERKRSSKPPPQTQGEGMLSLYQLGLRCRVKVATGNSSLV